MSFQFGQVSVPNGKSGPWMIDDVTISPAQAAFENLRFAIRGAPVMYVKPGTYKRLVRNEKTVVMSNTPMEVRTTRKAYDAARGRVLISGLGIGMVLEGFLSKPEVKHVIVVEIDRHIIRLVAPSVINDERVKIVNADIREYRLPRGEHFDFGWHDIWDDISIDHLPEMNRIRDRFRRRIDKQMFWGKDEAKAHDRKRF